MDIQKNAKTMLAIGSVLALVAVIYSVPLVLKALEPQVCTVDGVCEHEIFADNLIKSIPLVLILGIGIGAAAFYFFSERRTQNAKPLNKAAVYRLLDADEGKVLAKIVEGGGKALQSELSYIEGIGKTKAHRIIRRMEQKGVVEKGSVGKTNVVKLTRELQELFS